MILEPLFPDYYIENVYQLPLEELKSRGIRGLIFDIDNTIAPFDVADPDEKLMDFFMHLQEEGFRLGILSNNNKKRVQHFNRKLKLLAIHKADKPLPFKVKSGLKKLSLTPETSALVGDQVFTDVLCGHMAGMTAIMVAPICERDQLVTKVKRGLEKQVLKVYFRKNTK
ncbi:YqeG family HAD IIIA-type phosphatase [Chakrabartyella piscis]|uniref:YqeG family HAD IIIA-type phosphatase n=1 Tax=Chakrabartyella piscis TaxID=2918914 RepID=UPI0029586AD1|nr:YqeG family HAD IIIA-type phosphatase [Chakrabartyella piscis]